MKIETRDFGEINVSEEQFIEFEEPILGFEDEKFAILINDGLEDILWLQSVENKEVCFLMIEPGSIFSDYNPTIPEEIVEKMGLTKDNMSIHSLVGIPNDLKSATTNLRAPIIINKETRKAAQIVIDDDYAIKTPLFAKIPAENENKEEN